MSESAAKLPRPPGAMRRWLTAHPRFADYTILICYFIGAFPLALLGVFTEAWDSSLAPAVVVFNACFTFVKGGIVAAALIFRRSHPFIGLIATSIVLIGEGGPIAIANSVAVWFLLYAVAVYQGVRLGWIAYGAAVATRIVSAFVPPLYDSFGWASSSAPVTSTILDAVWLLVVLLVGINLGNRRRYLESIIDRANQLARERDQLAQLAVAEERSRIAREIHDIVAHSVSVMIALSEGGARAVDVAPEEAKNAMRRSAETGRTALTEMRRLLGALQTDEAAELAPQPGLSDIAELVRGFGAAGLNVEFSNGGVALDDRPQELAVYRLVQEGLTNVLRYAGEGARAEVSLTPSDSGFEVVVRDYGRAPGTHGPATGLGSGRGLAGLAERVRVFDGTIESGPVPGGSGWIVRAFFPFAPAAVREFQHEETHP